MLERRLVGPADAAFLRELYATTRPEVDSWDEAERNVFLEIQFQAQELGWVDRFPDSHHELILLDGRPVGRLWVAWSAKECRLVDMTLLPAHRRSGIGTRVVGDVLAEADRAGVPARLTVERTNLASLAFCARLGFQVCADDSVFVALERPRRIASTGSGSERTRCSGTATST